MSCCDQLMPRLADKSTFVLDARPVSCSDSLHSCNQLTNLVLLCTITLTLDREGQGHILSRGSSCGCRFTYKINSL